MVETMNRFVHWTLGTKARIVWVLCVPWTVYMAAAVALQNWLALVGVGFVAVLSRFWLVSVEIMESGIDTLIDKIDELRGQR